MSSRRKHHAHEEEHENHERWLVTYADMLPLLKVLFIVMFAMSQVDEKKYSALRSGLADGFGQDSSYMKGSDSILDADGDSVTSQLAADHEFRKLPASQQAAEHGHGAGRGQVPVGGVERRAHRDLVGVPVHPQRVRDVAEHRRQHVDDATPAGAEVGHVGPEDHVP